MKAGIAVITPLLMLLAIAAVAALVYFFFYRQRVNKALEEGGDADKAGPEPSSLTRTVLIIVLIIALILMMFRISDLKTKLNNMESTLGNMQQQLNVKLEEVREAVEKQGSLIESYSIDFGKLDAASHTADITFTVMPKESKADSMLTVTAGKQFVVLQRTAAGSYTGKLHTDIFADIDGSAEPRLTITTDGVMNTEVFARHELSELWYRYLPGIIVSGNYEGGPTKNGYSFKGDLHLDVFSKNDISSFIKDSFRLCAEVDGKITEEKDISSEINSYGIYYAPIEYTVGEDQYDKFRLIITAKDSNGYSHEYTFIGSDPSQHNVRIFDAAGNQLN